MSKLTTLAQRLADKLATQPVAVKQSIGPTEEDKQRAYAEQVYALGLELIPQDKVLAYAAQMAISPEQFFSTMGKKAFYTSQEIGIYFYGDGG
jgi:hypothetical protein